MGVSYYSTRVIHTITPTTSISKPTPINQPPSTTTFIAETTKTITPTSKIKIRHPPKDPKQTRHPRSPLPPPPSCPAPYHSPKKSKKYSSGGNPGMSRLLLLPGMGVKALLLNRLIENENEFFGDFAWTRNQQLRLRVDFDFL